MIETSVLSPTSCDYNVDVPAGGYESADPSGLGVPEDGGMTIELEASGQDEVDEGSSNPPNSGTRDTNEHDDSDATDDQSDDDPWRSQTNVLPSECTLGE